MRSLAATLDSIASSLRNGGDLSRDAIVGDAAIEECANEANQLQGLVNGIKRYCISHDDHEGVSDAILNMIDEHDDVSH